MEINKRKKYITVLDTETANGIVVNNKLDLSQSLVYDIGWQVIDLQGNVYEQRSYAVSEIFTDMADVMKSAYYADKLPRYYEEIKAGARILAPLFQIRAQLYADMEKYNCNIVSAHNASFDLNALNNTIRYVTKSAYRYFFKYDTEIHDTLKMSANVFGKQKKYVN